MAVLTAINGTTARESGYYADPHGHRVFVCRGDLVPSCPLYPFATTAWTITAAIGCQYEQESRRAAYRPESR